MYQRVHMSILFLEKKPTCQLYDNDNKKMDNNKEKEEEEVIHNFNLLHKTRPACNVCFQKVSHTHTHAMSPSKLLFAFFVLFLVSFSFGAVSVNAQEFEDKDKLMDELDRLKTFTETRIKNKETVLQARKNAWDREEKLDKSLEGLELEDKLEKQFEADLEQVKELGVVGGNNRRMLLLKR